MLALQDFARIVKDFLERVSAQHSISNGDRGLRDVASH